MPPDKSQRQKCIPPFDLYTSLTWELKSKKNSGRNGQGRPHLQVPGDSK